MSACLALAGCMHQKLADGLSSDPAQTDSDGNVQLAPFSAGASGSLPRGWKPLVLLRTKKKTDYRLVDEQDRVVLHARAAAASSGLIHEVNIDPASRPWLHWSWKIKRLIASADNTQQSAEDSPVRIVLAFDGDKEELPFADQMFFETAKLVTGHDFPYATLMYIWENREAVGTVIRNSRSSRVRMFVAASGPDGSGEWREFKRNIVEDYEKAFGEKPGRLIGVGVLTDTDNTGETAEAWYGDIRLLPDEREQATRSGASLPVGLEDQETRSHASARRTQ